MTEGIEIDAATAAEAQQFIGEIEALAATMPPPHTLPLEEQRAAMAAGAEPPSPQAVVDAIAGVPVRVLEPDTMDGTFLHIHGGGWTMGSNAFHDQRLRRFATEACVRVVSIDYRLAPEHPFPACIEDCLAVASALAGDRVVIGGESAGAHLSALVLAELRSGFCGANLAYGCYDLGMSPSQRAWGDRWVILSTPAIRWHLDQLLPGLDTDARRDPKVSPLYADLRGLPPALLTVGTEDPLLDDSVLMAERWPGARLDVYEGGVHAFDLFPIRLAEIAVRRQIDFVRNCLAAC
jgi:acetyl esterase/lipase